MTERALETALRARASAQTTGLPVRWPGDDAPVGDHIEFRPVRYGRSDPTIAGGKIESRGALNLQIVMQRGTGVAARANGHADTLAALFPFPERISFPGGCILITKPADIREGFLNRDTHWCVPVIVDYLASY
ncbi:phage tail terminator-like protein [Pseudogemmobacter faecipullorum]|uniref:DUF3168 domain-containing protein n=1 Tax=Pseudogemmobacter faecipullorum TaxID=2755041 RepID=A0ABS8CRJ7_9RHOB|nr:phage tail terminator-like protein [Pseudogemmobacter faecipullorum]MCB5411780.1 hypothetical protein [Pseudogemmobacter faecipullorum]